MSRRVFFSFHYENVCDFRVNVVRQHWLTKPNREEAGFFDHSLWESVKKTGTPALKRLINDGLEGSSVTCVLIGSETYARPWVRYELLKSMVRGNRILGVHINCIKGKNEPSKPQGPNPLRFLGVTFNEDGTGGRLFEADGANWVDYTEIGGSSSFSVPIRDDLRGKSYNLSQLFSAYDWIGDNGYENFATWIG